MNYEIENIETWDKKWVCGNCDRRKIWQDHLTVIYFG